MYKKINLFIIGVLILLSQFAFTQQACHLLFASHDDLIQSLQQSRIPFYMLELNEKKIPVILSNKETFQQVQKIYDNSIGFQVMSKAGWPNDHGSFRFGHILVDAFLAGQRQVGEIHQTGLSWKIAKDSAIFLDKIADIIGEALIFLTPSEMKSVELYQRVRRAALFRVPFLMGDQAIYKNFDNVLSDCGGYCFQFSHLNDVSNYLYSIRDKLNESDPNQTLRTTFKKDIDIYIEAVKVLLINANIFDANQLSERTLQHFSVKELVNKIVPNEWSERKRQIFLNYLVSESVVQEMLELKLSIGHIDNDPIAFAQRSARVNAIVVWDPEANPQQFFNAKYSSGGQIFRIPKGSQP